MGCSGSKGADASVELDDDVDPLVIEEALKQAAEAVQAAASAAEAAQAGAQRAAEAARAAAAAAALVAEAAGPAAAAAATKAFQQRAAQEGRQPIVPPPIIMPPRAWSPSPRDELSPRVRRPSIPKQESFGHRTHDEEVVEFEDEPDTPDDSEAEASDAEWPERVPVTTSTPMTLAAAHTPGTPGRNGGFKPRGPSPLALSAAAVPPVPIRDQAQSAALVAIWESEHRFTAEQEAAMAALRGKMQQAGLLTPFWDYKPAFYRFCQVRSEW